MNRHLPDDMQYESNGLDFSVMTDMASGSYDRSDGHDLFILEIDRIQGVMAIYDGPSTGSLGQPYVHWMRWPLSDVAVQQGKGLAC